MIFTTSKSGQMFTLNPILNQGKFLKIHPETATFSLSSEKQKTSSLSFQKLLVINFYHHLE